jgi:hypothetical protein
LDVGGSGCHVTACLENFRSKNFPMRALLTLAFVFGAVAVVYAMHWARRASSAVSDASSIFQQTGSVAETARQLYREQSMPSQIRLSHRQREFVGANFADFQRVYGIAIDEDAAAYLRRWSSSLETKPSEQEVRRKADEFFALSSLVHGRMYCLSKGVH